ncbi:hypothetical protein GGU10DRAFT_435514 [Lentinula aff. detonsa]|uniref:Transmembrane protein n=1 Tax=Lentinula aff. detonsa TaxID=2804958 RepID=A0AA38KR56_9AGAR|nr:hypothetical protein GGU10DRAFT_435514 [Lentinula aff. detonsa]
MAPNVISGSWTTRESDALSLYPTVAHLFLYGLHTSLFGVAIGIIFARKRRLYDKTIHLLVLTLLFIICTASAIARLVFVGLDTSGIKYSNTTPIYIIIGLHCFANLIADALLIYRCYHIWTPYKFILYPPMLGLLANFGIGIAALIDWNFYWLFMFITLVENLYLTAVTAGRIWYINRESKIMLGSKVHSRYQVIMASIGTNAWYSLESGSLYCLVLIVTALTLALPSHAFSQLLMFNVMLNIQIQIVGIAQSLLIVRVGLGVDICTMVEGSIAELSNLEAAPVLDLQDEQVVAQPSERVSVSNPDSSSLPVLR